jgi:G3E family GTPase
VLIKLLLVLPNIRGQIQCADLILFNKTDLHSAEMVDQVAERVQTINPRARVLRCVQCDFDPAVVLTEESAAALPADAEFNQCRDPRFERDALVFGSRPSIDEVRGLLAGETEGLYRAKGFVECHQGWFFLDWSGGRLACQAAAPQPVSSLTLIWDPQNEPPLVARLRFLAL